MIDIDHGEMYRIEAFIHAYMRGSDVKEVITENDAIEAYIETVWDDIETEERLMDTIVRTQLAVHHLFRTRSYG